MDTIERTVDDVIASLERADQRQRQMAETMSSFIDTILGEQTGLTAAPEADEGTNGDVVSDAGDQPPARLALA